MIDREEVIDPGFDSRLDGRRFQLFVAKVGQVAEFAGRRFQTGQAGAQLFQIVTGERGAEIGLDFGR